MGRFFTRRFAVGYLTPVRSVFRTLKEWIMSAQDNITAARRLLESGFGDGDLSVVDDYVASDFIEHQNGSQGTGPEALKKIIGSLHESFSDMRMTIADIVAAGDDVWVRARATGHNDRPVMGRPPTGKDFEIDVIDVIRFRDGKMVEHWGVADRLGMIQTLGLMPDSPRRAA
jgi:predicted ester cyclase